MKILACGDTHMDTSSVCNVAIPKARKNDCKFIVQVGDFGFWEPELRAVRFLNKVSKCLVRESVTMIWLDGNHERHKVLWDNYPGVEIDRTASFGARTHAYKGLCEIRPNLFYAPRGHVMQIGPAKCLFVGGAYSIDKSGRIADELTENQPPGTYWSPDEMLTRTDIERSIRHARLSGPIDLMFTHDVPTGIDVPGVHASGKEFFPESTRNRMMLREIFDEVQPKMLVHGHYHERYTGKLPLKPKVRETLCKGWEESDLEHLAHGPDLLDWDYCRVDGLSYNGNWGFVVILDLDSLFVSE